MRHFLLIVFILASLVMHAQTCPEWVGKTREFSSLPNNYTERTSGWSQIDALSDDFAGTSLNLSKWQVNNSYCHSMSPYAYFSNSVDNVKVEGGRLKLRAKALVDSVLCTLDSKYYHYSSGYIELKDSIHYGYMEIKCYLPHNVALNPCFWSYGNDGFSYDEIDVFEKDISNPRNDLLLQNFYHNLDFSGTSKLQQNINFDQEVVGDTAIFAVEWLPEELNYYINGEIFSSVRYSQNPDYRDPDGKSSYTCTDFIYGIRQYIQLSLSVNQEIINNPDISEGFEIDYVKSFKLRDGGNIDYWPSSFSMSNPDMFKVYRSVRLGGTDKTAVIPTGVNATIWARDSVVLYKGFTLSGNTNFTARTIKTQSALLLPPYNDEDASMH